MFSIYRKLLKSERKDKEVGFKRSKDTEVITKGRNANSRKIIRDNKYF